MVIRRYVCMCFFVEIVQLLIANGAQLNCFFVNNRWQDNVHVVQMAWGTAYVNSEDIIVVHSGSDATAVRQL